MKWLYLAVNAGTILIPFIFSFHPKLKFNKYFKQFFIANAIVASIFIVWDMIFTSKGIWGFNPDYITGIYILNLPIEEVLFFICIPFACVFTYHCFRILIKLNQSKVFEDLFIPLLVAILFITGIFCYDKIYTATTFISLSIILLVIKYILKPKWITAIVITYSILLIPFFIVNGILTGIATPEPVVWYDNNENLGIRLFTIPIEDVFYGFLLILLNVFLFEKFKKTTGNISPNNQLVSQ